jgi:hypothetical protein
MFGQRYVAFNNEWRSVQQAYVGHNGQWVPQFLKFKGINGRWVEISSSELPNPSSAIRIDSISYRAGCPEQAALTFKGYNLQNLVLPEPRTFAHYSLLTNFTDALQNYSNCVPFNSPTFTSENGGGLTLVPSLSQYFTLPTAGAGLYDSLSLISPTGRGLFICCVHLNLNTLFSSPASETTILFAGSTNNHLYLAVRDNSDVVFGWFSHGDRVEVSLPGVAVQDTWMAFLIKHEALATPGRSILTLRDNLGNSVSSEVSLPYFVPLAGEPVVVGRTQVPISVVLGDYFDTTNTHSVFTIVSPTVLTNSTNTYRSSQPGRLIYPNTGTYYIEIKNFSSFDVQFGVGEPGAVLTNPAATEGWVVNTIAGRRFDHQTGGGTAWSSPIPANVTIGLLLDTDNGQIEVFVNGVSRGRPFPVGSITVPVKFLLSGRGDTASSNIFQAEVVLEDFDFPVSGSSPFPVYQSIDNVSYTYLDGTIRKLTVRNEPLASIDVEDSLLDTDPVLEIQWRRLSDSQVFDGSNYLLVSRDTEIVTNVPNLEPGNYAVSVLKAGTLRTSEKFFTVVPFQSTSVPLSIDFRTATFKQIDDNFIRAHKQWGGLNGGVIAENVFLDRENGILRCRALGDLYTGPLRGVDRFGRRTSQATRIGGCVVTKKYYGPGSYRVVARLPSLTGVVSAFWTFHYEEGYPGSPVYDSHLADGLRVSGNAEDGFYTVRNHEIDIEIPTALKTDPDYEVVSYLNGRFNTWRGELRNWDVPESDPSYWTEYVDEWLQHGVNVNDGQFHEFRFDWHTSGTPRVEFFIDSIPITTITDQIPDIPGRFWVGLWFPSATGNRWAGAQANFQEQYMDVRSIQITPYPSDPVRNITESYPDDVFRNMFLNQLLDV